MLPRGTFARGCAMWDLPKPTNEDQGTVDSSVSEQNLQTMSINNVSSYTLACTVNGTPVSFLIDTGAGVCLLKSEVWERVKSKGDTLKPITAHRLVGLMVYQLRYKGQLQSN